jgi:hypothetical protein
MDRCTSKISRVQIHCAKQYVLSSWKCCNTLQVHITVLASITEKHVEIFTLARKGTLVFSVSDVRPSDTRVQGV